MAQQPDYETFLPPRLRTMQIIILALTAGALIFLVIVYIQKAAGNGPSWDRSPFLTYFACGYAAVMLLLNLLVPGMIVAAGRRRIARNESSAVAPQSADPTLASDSGRLCLLYQTQMIVGASFLEGAAFLAVIAFMLEDLPLAKYLALLLILGITLKFPTRPRLERWLEDQRELVLQERARHP